MGPTLKAALGFATASLVAVPLTVRAQGNPVLPRAGAGTIAGLVVDTLGRPIEGASVFLQERRREVRTGADGVFRFQGLMETDTLTVAARRIGYFPLSARVPIGPEGRQVIFQLNPRLTSLPAAVTEIELAGLRGVVSDTSLVPLRGATVSVLGGNQGIAKTDSGGAFFLNVKPGHYMVRVTQERHQEQMISVTVPPKGGRRLAVQLTPGVNPYHTRQAAYADQLRDRLIRRNPAHSRLFTREDIGKMNVADMSQLASIGAVQRVDENCTATVNGGMSQVPLWALDAEDVEFMEVYARLPNSGNFEINPRGVTSINGSQPIRTQSRSPRATIGGGIQPCPAGVMVWTRK
jgi:hypothetical protein